MALIVVWTQAATLKLRRLTEHIANDNADAAVALADRLSIAANRLAELPYLGRPGRQRGSRELVVHPNYLVIYRVLSDKIEVISVKHARQNYRRSS